MMPPRPPVLRLAVLGLLVSGCASNRQWTAGEPQIAVAAPATAPLNQELPTLFLAGDSTVHNTGQHSLQPGGRTVERRLCC